MVAVVDDRAQVGGAAVVVIDVFGVLANDTDLDLVDFVADDQPAKKYRTR